MDQQPELGFAEAQYMSMTILAFQPAAYTNLLLFPAISSNLQESPAKAERLKKALVLEEQSG